MSAKDVGTQLRQARQAMGASLEEASEATRIRRYYLESLEAGDFGELPSPVQVRGFLRAYAKYLNLNAEDLFAALESHAQKVAEEAEAPPPAAAAAQSPEQAQGLFREIGEQLRQRRKSLELSLEEVEQHTHIPEHYVQRLEAGRLDEFPSPTQARGMLSNYADFLGMETAAVMDRYAEALQSRRPVEEPRQRRSLPVPALTSLRIPQGWRSFLSADLVIGVLIGISLIAFVVFSIGRINATRAAAEPEATAPPLAEVLAASPTTLAVTTLSPTAQAETNLIIEATETPEGTLPATVAAANPGSVVVQVLANQRAFLRITADNEVVFEGRTLPGGSYNFTANGQIILLTGNGAALRVIANGDDLGLLGIYGEVVELVFNTQGATTPSPTPTATIDPDAPTETPTPTPTLEATGSLTPELSPTATVDPASATP